MRALSLVGLACSVLVTDALAEEVDYTKFARAERAQLAKCFTDVLIVVKRHSLRANLLYFLEAGCAAEMRSYETALGPHLKNELQQFAEPLRPGILHMLASHHIGSMQANGERLYKDQSVPFCSGDACVLDTYRVCLLVQIPDEITKRTEPRKFEEVAREKCRATENAARYTLTVDFLSAQKLQLDPELSGKTRDLINEAITGIRHTSVAAYAEDLTKVQPDRKSCKPVREMCGNSPCLSIDTEAEPEYKCAIGERQH